MNWIYGINIGAKHKKKLSESRQRENLSIKSGRKSAIFNVFQILRILKK